MLIINGTKSFEFYSWCREHGIISSLLHTNSAKSPFDNCPGYFAWTFFDTYNWIHNGMYETIIKRDNPELYAGVIKEGQEFIEKFNNSDFFVDLCNKRKEVWKQDIELDSIEFLSLMFCVIFYSAMVTNKLNTKIII